jgi:hypothetical protein
VQHVLCVLSCEIQTDRFCELRMCQLIMKLKKLGTVNALIKFKFSSLIRSVYREKSIFFNFGMVFVFNKVILFEPDALINNRVRVLNKPSLLENTARFLGIHLSLGWFPRIIQMIYVITSRKVCCA